MVSPQAIRAAVNRHKGFDRSNHFEVEIHPPAALQSNIMEDLKFFCSDSTLPSIGLQSADIIHNGYGIQEKRANAMIFEDAQLTFMNDSQGQVYEFFKKWISYVIPFEVTENTKRERFRFPDEYSGTVIVKKYRVDGDATYDFKLVKAYPITIGSVPMGWGTQNEVIRIPVNFTYHSWVFERQ